MTLPEWSLPAAVVAQWRATPIPENQIEGLFAEKRCSHIEATRIPPFVREKKAKLWAANLVAKTNWILDTTRVLNFYVFPEKLCNV